MNTTTTNSWSSCISAITGAQRHLRSSVDGACSAEVKQLIDDQGNITHAIGVWVMRHGEETIFAKQGDVYAAKQFADAYIDAADALDARWTSDVERDHGADQLLLERDGFAAYVYVDVCGRISLRVYGARRDYGAALREGSCYDSLHAAQLSAQRSIDQLVNA